MAGSGAGFDDDPIGPVCYSELLFGDHAPALDTHACTSFDFSGDNTPKMLCFGDYANAANFEPDRKPEPEPAPKSNKKRSEGQESGAPAGNRRSGGKKQKGSKCTGGGGNGNGKVVKKEKLGERITALQQLVSPFGKTDTASVLHEALGYIRFLQDQVQVLCSPYLHRCASTADGPPAPMKGDLRSRGLCLVPVELTVHVAESNGADLWTSAAMLDSVYSV